MPRTPRIRTVIFRVTQNEHDRLKCACAAAGARTLSDFTRSQLLTSISTDSQGLTVPERFEVIDQKLGELKETVSRVEKRLDTEDATEHHEGN